MESQDLAKLMGMRNVPFKINNVTIHTPDYVPAGGIIVSVDCSEAVYGYAALKVTLK